MACTGGITISIRTIALLSLALLFFASNSILCRLALINNSIDAISFTLVRIASGAMILNVIMLALNKWKFEFTGRMYSAIALLVYAFLFSLAYVRLAAATGALILFGFVQVTMIGWSICRGLGPTINEWIGLGLAVSGLSFFLMPGLKAPDPFGAAYMAIAGIGWGAYSILGKGSKNPVSNTAGNFLLGCLLMSPISLLLLNGGRFSAQGFGLAALSGAVASGLGYSVWYSVLLHIKSTQAAIVQLMVPAIAAFLATVVLHERISTRLIVSAVVISIGVFFTIMRPIKTAD